MPEYIDKGAAIEKTEAFCDTFVTKWTDEKVIAWIKKLPTADVAPVVHGWWIKQEGQWRMHESGESVNIHLCSCCGGYFRNAPYKYCPHCGARMDGVPDEKS